MREDLTEKGKPFILSPVVSDIALVVTHHEIPCASRIVPAEILA